jgi:hypothetical protein
MRAHPGYYYKIGLFGLRFGLRAADGTMAGGLRAFSRRSNPCDRLWGPDGSVEPLLLGSRQRPLGGEGDPRVVDDLVYDRIVGDEG